MPLKKAVLLLEDGTLHTGRSFGWPGEKTAEVVFNTSMTGYEEILTDPSYSGQMVVMCAPHVGNYGINFEDAESHKIWAEGFIVGEYSKIYSSRRAEISLGEFLKRNRISGIEGIDTRSIVKRIREKGSMKGILSAKDFSLPSLEKKLKKSPSIAGHDLVSLVNRSPFSLFRKFNSETGVRLPVTGHRKQKTVVLIDYGAKLSIMRHLEERGLRVIVLPGRSALKDVLSH
ncbi:MAG TPA: carbamoyl-phosphate synthase domain-containing protein, partial [bacterium]|nr:carbamoyl-phosphate synthase domain-containing protein [bacterium]